MRALFRILLLAALGAAMSGSAGLAGELVSYPLEIDPGCRGGRAMVYDECGDQLAMYAAARARAKSEGKTLLVSAGAEWCIWCHVFSDYVKGEHDAFTHSFSDPEEKERSTATLYERAKGDASAEAAALAAFVAENFVLAHLDIKHAPGGWEALTLSGADQRFGNWIPFIYTVTPEGRFGAALDHDEVEVRRDTKDWFRGYDRAKLTKALARMKRAAR